MSRYELLERIGVGGMAEVFRGVVTSVGGFKKEVAIKKILPHLGRDDRFVRMLIGEAKILANLRQRNIVQIYDVAQGEDGEFFLAMEFVEGTDLGALYERMEPEGARMSLTAALHIGAEVCEALDHAHRVEGADGRVGLIHRDVSLSNVLISYSGEVKLTDFGIAKQQDERSVVASLKGKFAYMSPEQARAQPLDTKTDLYSLGVVLYELLLGRRLFYLTDLDALRFVREGRVPRPSSVDADFAPALEEILLKAMAADPRQRFASAADMGNALREYRYSATSGGDPAREIAKLVHKYFPSKKVKPPEPTQVVRLTTVASFRTGDLVLDDALATDSGVAWREDTPTRARDISYLAERDDRGDLGASTRPRTRQPRDVVHEGGREGSKPSVRDGGRDPARTTRRDSGREERDAERDTARRSARERPPASGRAHAFEVKQPPPASARASEKAAEAMDTGRFAAARRPLSHVFDVSESGRYDESAPTFERPLPAGSPSVRPPAAPPPARHATPTVKDVFPAGALLPHDEVVLVHPVGEADDGAFQRRRVLVIAIAVMVLTALVAFVIAGTMTDEEDEPGIFRTPTGTGESLPSPQIKQPVKRGRR